MRDGDSIFGARPERLDRLLRLGLHEPKGPEPSARPILGLPVPATALAEQPGSRIGRYHLLEIIGEGGMGIIYRAEQREPVRRQVALKILKPGMDSQRVLARFEVEQQALALMEHPHIARVYDAGLAPNGRPYFVMEYVKGIPITAHCDQYRLTIEQRLHLFLHVCAAVQHAHQKGVIHRDLKPSNILVVIQDQEMVPKVIDFGVARAISQPLTERTFYTEQGQLIGTPEYTSPEQADLGNQDIDTRTDIYSLGVVLYELLAGVLPFDPQPFRTGGIDHIRQIICEEEPLKPSAKLTMLGGKLKDTARQRGTTLEQLPKAVRGDLDWIAMRCLEKDRTRRYETVNALAVDIERHLNDDPISARPPSKLYRFQKLVRRNQGIFAGAAVVALVLLLGALVSTWQAVRATRAEREQSRLREVVVWDVGQRTIVRRIPGVRLLGAHLGSLDFSPDGKALVIGDADHHLRVIDVASGSTRFDSPEAHLEAISFVSWSPNGSIIASGSGYVGGPISLWEAASGRPLGALEGHASWISELIFSPDGLRLYSASADQTIRIWNVQEKRCLATLRGSSDEIYGLALSPDGTTLASASKDGVVAFWDAEPRFEEEQPRLIALGQIVWPWPAFAPDSRVLAVPRKETVNGADRTTVRLLDLATGAEIERLPELGDDVRGVSYSPDGALLLSGGMGRIRVWSCVERRLLGQLGDPNAPLYPSGLCANGTRLVARDKEGKVTWLDTRTWQTVRTIVADSNGVSVEGVSPEGRLWAQGTFAGAVRWLNAETGELLATTSAAHRNRVWGLAFSADGTQAASVAEDGTVALWDPSSFQLIVSFKGHMQGAHGVAFSPEGRRLATGGGGREAVKLWDLSTRRELTALPGQGSVFQLVAFSPDGRWLIACNREGQLHLWRAPSWEEIEAVEKDPKSSQLPQHE